MMSLYVQEFVGLKGEAPLGVGLAIIDGAGDECGISDTVSCVARLEKMVIGLY